MSMSSQNPDRPCPNGFAATRWTVVMAAAKGRDSLLAAEALTDLCRTYWYPLYAFLRRRGYESHEAEDLTQAFFASLLARDFLANIDRQKGQFRSFLLSSLKHFLSDERDRASAQKRGGGRPVISLDCLDAENRYRLEPAHDLSPEKIYEKQWALSVLELVLSRLQSESAAAGKTALFEALQATLVESQSSRYAAIASELHMTEGAVKTAAHRFRRRYRDLLIEEIAQTVADSSEVEGEIRYLMSCL
jgi:DNA-directed RNA polymerase specialized sigma24 family protein